MMTAPRCPRCRELQAQLDEAERTIRAYQIQARKASDLPKCPDCNTELPRDYLNGRRVRCADCQRVHYRIIHRRHARESARRRRATRKEATAHA